MSVQLGRGVLSGASVSSIQTALSLIWSAFAFGQWRRGGKWAVAVIILAALWLGLTLWTFCLARSVGSFGEWDMPVVVHSWFTGIVIPCVLISANLRLCFSRNLENE
jgi:hypothetical protein